MRKMLITAAATALIAGVAGAALAEDGRHVAPASSGGVRDAIRATLESTGYRVARIKAEHGAYEVQAVNDSGFPIKATYHTSGELIQARLR
jgi:hypothetical protein